MVRRRVKVSGEVQGVFFRDTCKQQAEAAGVAGWVRNAPDGAVEAVFEGEPDAVEGLVAWCHGGPDQAHVADVDVSEEEVEGLKGFAVR